MKNFGFVHVTMLIILAGCSWGTTAFGAGHTAKEVPSDFDRLTILLQQPNSLSAATPDWLELGVEHRTRYETFSQSFTRGTAGSNQQIHQRTRLLLGIKNIWDPVRFTFEVADFRTPVADRGQDHNPIFVNHLDIFQLHLDLVSQNIFGTGTSSKLEIGRVVMDFGQGRLVAGHRFGSFTPTFDGVQLTLGGHKSDAWGLRAFVTRPVQRHSVSPDWSSPVSYFSGIAITSKHIPWANSEAYYFQLNEGSNLQQRRLSTLGFRLFALPVRERWDYEIESTYQIGEVAQTNHFAHRHHGEMGYSLGTDWPLRFVYLFDYASGDPNPNKNFDFLFAKRRVEYGPTGILGIIFPSNILSPVGFRSTLQPIPTVVWMVSYRTFWLADGRGPYVGSGLQDPTGGAGTFLGHMFDTSVNWAPQAGYFRHTIFEAGFTHFLKGSYFDRVPQSPGTADVNYVYTMATLTF
ncbi:MAG: alginate export family protein [Nitrospirota bacterium]|nr:alginate export family protein [Nitrospirota bacterium]MDH5775389.1 alginate export family protein [Nitrospirota bacterium]